MKRRTAFIVILLLAAAAGTAFWYLQQDEARVSQRNSEQVIEHNTDTINVDDNIETAYTDSAQNGDDIEIGDDEVNPELLKWVGSYRLKIEQQEGDDGKYWAIAEILVNPEGDGHYNYWYADFDTEKKIEDDAQVYGQYEVTGDSLYFSYEVQAGGPANSLKPEFSLFEENGTYYIKSPQFYSDRADEKIEIEKIK